MASKSIYDDIKFADVGKRLRSLNCKELQLVANTFCSNLDDIHALITLPLGLINVGLWEADRIHHLSGAIREQESRVKAKLKPLRRSRVVTQASHKFDKTALGANSDAARGKMVDAASELLSNLLNHDTFDEVRSAVRALFYSCVSLAWGAFESAAKDCWIASVNLYPSILVPGIVGKVQGADSVEGVSSKSISFGILAKHGFDLRGCVGDVLAPKFDFTGVAGIRVAYSAAFGANSDIASALASPNLVELEATRHLVVHRAGWIDSEYLRRVRSEAKLGSRLEIAGGSLGELVSSGSLSALGLLLAVDDWVLKQSVAK